MPSISVAANIKSQSSLGSMLFARRALEATIHAGAVIQPILKVVTPVATALPSHATVTANLFRHQPLAASLQSGSTLVAIRAPEDYQAGTEMVGHSHVMASLRQHVPLASHVVAASAAETEARVDLLVSATIDGHAAAEAGSSAHYHVFSNGGSSATIHAGLGAHYRAMALVVANSELGGRLLMFSISQGMLVEPEERSVLRNDLSTARRFRIKPSG